MTAWSVIKPYVRASAYGTLATAGVFGVSAVTWGISDWSTGFMMLVSVVSAPPVVAILELTDRAKRRAESDAERRQQRR